MAVTQVGLVYYADDPTQSPFRIVYPTVDDSELDDPQWTTNNLDDSRSAAMLLVAIEDSPGLGGLTATPGTSADDALMNFAYSCPAVQAAASAGATNLADIQAAALSAAQDAAGVRVSPQLGKTTNIAQASLTPAAPTAPADILAAAQDAASAIDLVLPNGD